MKRLTIFLLVFMLMFSVYATAAEKMLIAVMDLKGKGVPKILAGAVTDIIRSEMVKTGLYTVVERSQMDEILKEQGFQQTGCTDQSCAVQLGKLLSARKILIGEINKVGTAIMITIRIVDVEKGVSEYSANEKARSEDVLDDAAKKLTLDLSLNIVEGNKEFFVERKSAGGYYSRGIVPGWGQAYAGKPWKGAAFAGLFIASAAFTTWAILDYKDKDSEYDNLPYGTSRAEFDKKYDDSQKAGKLALIAAGTTAFIYIANWMDILFFSAPDFGNKTAWQSSPDSGCIITMIPTYNLQNAGDKGIKFSMTLRY